MKKDNPWKRIDSKTIYQNPWLRLREDNVLRPDGKPGIYSVLEIGTSVGIVAINNRDEIILVGQWRYVHNKFSWEIPTGGIKEESETPLEVAQRELREETGIIANNWLSMGSIENSNGATDDIAYLYYASDLSSTEQALEPTEDIITKWIKFEKALEMVKKGEITESCSVASILKVKLFHRNNMA